MFNFYIKKSENNVIYVEYYNEITSKDAFYVGETLRKCYPSITKPIILFSEFEKNSKITDKKFIHVLAADASVVIDKYSTNVIIGLSIYKKIMYQFYILIAPKNITRILFDTRSEALLYTKIPNFEEFDLYYQYKNDRF